MKKTYLIGVALATVIACMSPAMAGQHDDNAAKPVTVAMNPPACTGESSVFEVIGGSCNLVKGSMIYGDIGNLSGMTGDITNGVSGTVSSGQ